MQGRHRIEYFEVYPKEIDTDEDIPWMPVTRPVNRYCSLPLRDNYKVYHEGKECKEMKKKAAKVANLFIKQHEILKCSILCLSVAS